MSSPFESSPTTPAYERRAHKMSAQSPSSNWLLDQGTPLGELTWTKNHELSSIPALDSLDINDVLAADVGTSSGSSTYSDSDAYPTFGMHHLPAWSTVAINRKAQRDSNSSAGAVAAGSVSRGVSPAAGISPSGLSDEGNAGPAHGMNSLGGSMDDIWFLSSPGASEPRSSALPAIGLQRKKKMHFKPSFPSNRLGGGADRGNDEETARANMLKNAKSMPQIARRVSSNYTARLEDLLSEMGWPRQEPDSFLESDDEDGDQTIQGTSSGSSGPSFQSAPLQQSHSYAGFTQVPASPYNASSGSSLMTTSATASGLPAAATPSALFQRRAGAREGTMPSPSPVSIPRRSQGSDGPKTDAGIIPIRMDTRQQPSPANLVPHSAGLSGSENGMTPASAHMLFAQPFDGQAVPQTQTMASHAGANHGAGPSRSNTASSLQGAMGQQLMASTSSDNNGANYPMFFYGHPVTNTRSSIGSSASGLSAASGNPDAAQNRHQNLPFGVSPASTATRSLTASTTSNYTELLTPVTPFSNMPFSNVNAGQWNVMQPFDVQGQQASQPEFSLLPLPTKIGSSDPTMPGFTNALGLYHDPSAVPEQAHSLNPTSIIDPAAYAHLLGAGLLNHTDLSAATKFNRARASTAMAALDMPRSGPRAMRSQPNLRTTPPGTSMGYHGDNGMSFSTQTTPHKTPRKIASNRRLNMQTPVSPASLSNHQLPPQSPHSPMKRARSNLQLATGPFGTPAAPSGGGAFEFINYGIEDADELCSAVAPSGSYKIPLKGFGSASGAEDDDDDLDGNDSDDGRSGGEGSGRSPRRTRRRAKSGSNRHGPRWEDPVPPLPGFNDGNMAHGIGSTRSNNDVPLPPSSPMSNQASNNGGGRQIKRRKSDASMMLAGRMKSASMANLRK